MTPEEAIDYRLGNWPWSHPAFNSHRFALFYGSGAALKGLQANGSQQAEILSAFHDTYITVGCLSMLATLIFRRLPQKNHSLSSAEEEPVIRR